MTFDIYARKFSVSPSIINRKISKLGINYRKRETTSYYTEKQKLKSIGLCSKLANKLYRNFIKYLLCARVYESSNVSQARPIESFWGCLARKVYENVWFANLEVKLTQ